LQRWRNGRLEPVVDDSLRADSSIRALFADSEGRLWIALDRAQGVVILENGRTRRFDGGDALFGEVVTMTEWPRSTLWFGTQREGLFRLHADMLTHFGTAEGIPRVAITDLRPAREGGMWIAAGTLKLVTDPERFTWATIPDVPNDNVRSVYEDREDGVWLCAGAEGLVRMRRMQYRALTVAEGLPTNNVKTVAEDSAGSRWLAVQQHGVTQVPPDGRVRIHGDADGIPEIEAAVVYPARDGSVWAGTRSRLYVRRNGTWNRFSDARYIRGLYEDRHGAMWVGTEAQGVLRFEGAHSTEVRLPSGQPIPVATSFCEGPNDTLYIGTWRNGVCRVRGGEVQVFDRAQGLPTDDVRAVWADREGRLWVGLAGRGLAVLDEGRWLSPDVLAAAVGNQVSAIAEDDLGRLWLGTPAGIMWADAKELLAAARGLSLVPPVHLIAASGEMRTIPVWSGGQPVVWRNTRGELLFATRRGVVAIDPRQISVNTVRPPVHIEQALVDRQAVATTAALELPAGARTLAIEYTGLSFVQPSQVFFRYKLDGYDLDWIEAGPRRTASYSRLPPGDYVFRVMACNNDGVWNLAGASIVVRQHPYFHQTRWFYLLLIAVGAAAAWGLHRWSQRRLKLKLAQLEREHAMENERRRIAQDLHDDLGASLTEIGLFAESAQRDHPAGARSEFTFLSQRVHQLVNSLDAIVWAVNPANDSLDHLVAYMSEFFQELFRRSAIRARLEIAPHIPRYPLTAEERSHLFLAAKEGMNNILKHSGATEAWLRIAMEGDEVRITIEDNGRGFDLLAAHHAEANGLTNLRNRLEKLRGRIDVRSAPDQGTTLAIAVRFAGRQELPTPDL
jgi:signal transduction histidine kinase/ligand-binding sensor domain-containing protein